MLYALKYKFRPVILFFFDSQLTGLIQNKQNTAFIKAFLFFSFFFLKNHGVYSYNQWNYFQRGCMDKWRSGDFSMQTWCISLEALEAFASENCWIHIFRI